LGLRGIGVPVSLAESHAFPRGLRYQEKVAETSFRFLDCATQYSGNSLTLLLQALQVNTPMERKRWFEKAVLCRRRTRKWEQLSIATIFGLDTEFHLLYQRSLGLIIHRALAQQEENSILKAFNLFDLDGNGTL